MATNPVERGPVSEAVSENLKALRDRRGMSAVALSERLAALGRPMGRSAITKVEGGDRRVDVDDLMAFAVALNVSPARLLLADVDPDDETWVTPTLAVPAWAAWQWMEGQYALPLTVDGEVDPGNVDPAVDLGYHELMPTWRRLTWQHPLSQSVRWATKRVEHLLDRAVTTPARNRKPNTIKRLIKSVRDAQASITAELDRLEQEL